MIFTIANDDVLFNKVVYQVKRTRRVPGKIKLLRDIMWLSSPLDYCRARLCFLPSYFGIKAHHVERHVYNDGEPQKQNVTGIKV